MQLPFSSSEFFAVFRAYNLAVWPAQIVLLALAVAVLALIARPRSWSGSAIAGILAFFWAWLAVVYHLLFFAEINPLAPVFAIFSLAGAIVFAWFALRGDLRFAPATGPRAVAGGVLIAFALIVYPAWSWLGGHAYPAMPTFGLPCPTTLFTIGVTGFLVAPHPRILLAVPVLWCVVGAQAAFLLGVTQDLGLVAAGLAGLWFMLAAGRREAPPGR
jgi:hypothetical protein